MVTSSIFNPAAVAPYIGPTYASPEGLRTFEDIRTYEQYSSISPDSVIDSFFCEERRDIARRFVEGARVHKPRAEVVYATRRNGKTALTLYLMAIAKRDLPEALVLRLDGSTVSKRYSDMGQFYRDLLKHESGFERVLKKPNDQIRTAVWQKIHNISQKRPVIIMLDEPDAIITNDHNIFREWRALFERGDNVSLLFTSFTEALLVMMRDHSGIYSSSMNNARELGLQRFSAKDCGEMLLHRLFAGGSGVHLSDGFKDMIRVITGGNPYLVDGLVTYFHDVFNGKKRVDWRAVTDDTISAPDYLLLLPDLVRKVLRMSDRVKEPFNCGISADGYSFDQLDESKTGGFFPGRYFEILSRRLLLSGRTTFNPETIFGESDIEKIGLSSSEGLKRYWQKYLTMTWIVREGFTESGQSLYTLDQFPFLAYGDAFSVNRDIAPSIGLAHLFERYPNHSGRLEARFKEDRMVVDPDEQRSDDSVIYETKRAPGFSIFLPPRDMAEFWFHHNREVK